MHIISGDKYFGQFREPEKAVEECSPMQMKKWPSKKESAQNSDPILMNEK
jgi:hypothetical protein